MRQDYDAESSHLKATLLYAPAINREISFKALQSVADIVVLDLEDSVVPSKKDEARNVVREVMKAERPVASIQIRINHQYSPWHFDDIKLVNSLPPYVEVRIPKIETAEEVCALKSALPGRKLHVLIETARGVENAYSIANSGVNSIGLGEADLRSDLFLPNGLEGEPGLNWSRSRIISAAASAGLKPPMMSVYTNLADQDGLRETSRQGRSLGFYGRAAIHPKQLTVIAEAFHPSVEEIKRAEELLSKLTKLQNDSSGVGLLADGSFVDAAMIKYAKRVMNLVRE